MIKKRINHGEISTRFRELQLVCFMILSDYLLSYKNAPSDVINILTSSFQRYKFCS